MSDYLLDPLAGCRAYLEAHRHHAAKQNPKTLPVVTISREAGAGAVTIGTLTAQLLNQNGTERNCPPWTVFDKNLVEKVIEDHQFPAHLKQFLPEDVLPGVTSAVEEMLGLHPSAWTLAQHSMETILRLAHLGNVILVGRGSNLITAKIKPAVHVRLVAPFEERVKHIAEFYHLTPSEAEAYTRKADQGRRRYVKRYFRTAIEDPMHYSLVINTGKVDYHTAAHIIAEAVRQCAAG